MLAGILIPLSFFALVFGLMYMYWTTRHKERLTMLEKGADPSLFRAKMPNTMFFTLKLGLLFIGVALGVLFGSILEANTNLDEGAAYVSMIFLFGGIGLVVGYIFQSKKTE
ncbi:DUF6249 domain-containing protein [Mangrovibacterium diazotrophicum]|uniref:DUF6249 domain-containing protein n=1 Tax=Mangrovibacterium diazotrophicum TaxID=1261403 RepID=A0A419VZ14_9BACT|nr:DUF6249 domain-containing protein [Mangrovibacterium diazotrophicum]RKD88483.1 hypothetical protein BC643_3632 [Mangrovibacterium diazotrophicum]